MNKLLIILLFTGNNKLGEQDGDSSNPALRGENQDNTDTKYRNGNNNNNRNVNNNRNNEERSEGAVPGSVIVGTAPLNTFFNTNKTSLVQSEDEGSETTEKYLSRDDNEQARPGVLGRGRTNNNNDNNFG